MKSYEHMQYFPITPEESAFITRTAAYISERKYTPENDRSRIYLDQQRLAIRRSAISDLQHLLQCPGTASKTKIGKLLRHMDNIDRISLLRMRPTLIDNFHDLKFIVSEYIPVNDRLLFTMARMHLLFHPDLKTCELQVARMTDLIPWQDVEHFSKAATKIMMEMHHQRRLHPTPELTHADYFNSALILSLFGSFCSLFDFHPLWKYGSFLLAVGSAAAGFWELNESKPGALAAHTEKFMPGFWTQPEPAGVPPKAPLLTRKMTYN